MLREIVHMLRGSREVLALKRALPKAEFYDAVMSRGDEAGLAEHRRALAEGLRGRVLEIGCGTGLMFSHYGPEAEVLALDVDADVLAIARARAAHAEARVEVRAGSADALPFADASFDAIVVALVLCSVPDVEATLRELVRVARPGAEIRLLEHVRSPRPVAGALMAALDPLWLVVNGQGCHMARRTEEALAKAGLALRSTTPFQLFAPGLPAFPMRRIVARAPGA